MDNMLIEYFFIILIRFNWIHHIDITFRQGSDRVHVHGKKKLPNDYLTQLALSRAKWVAGFIMPRISSEGKLFD